MIVGEKLAPWEDPVLSDRVLSKLGFFRKTVLHMLQRDPSLRPSMADVEQACRAVLSDTPSKVIT